MSITTSSITTSSITTSSRTSTSTPSTSAPFLGTSQPRTGEAFVADRRGACPGVAREEHFGIDFRVLDSVEDAAEGICDLIGTGHPGSVFTCNLDHLAIMRHDDDFRHAYTRASFITADGAPIVAFSRLVSRSLGTRITGADLVPALAAVAARRGLRFALVGAAPGVAAEAGRRLEQQFPGLEVVLTVSPPMGFEDDEVEDAALMAALLRTKPQIVVIAFGAPRQELWIDRHAPLMRGVVFIGAGASIDFIAGRQKRAPRIFMKFGLEWLHRLVTNFRRLWRRYLVQDVGFLLLAGREALSTGRGRQGSSGSRTR